jgi:hypothetical protein
MERILIARQSGELLDVFLQNNTFLACPAIS